jgi:hypothetical protein
MTLSNFDWTDKTSVRWFILLPSGHVGPYCLDDVVALCDKNKHKNVQIWTEGLKGPVSLTEFLARSAQNELPPPLPIVEEIPPLPEIPTNLKKSSFYLRSALVAGVLVCILALSVLFIKNKEVIEISRLPKMSMKLHERIKKDNEFQSWDKKIFFREYIAEDYKQIWLVTSSFHRCSVDASFNSVQDKLLTLENDVVQFQTRGELVNHIVNFNSFEFSSGLKIIPGLYELEVRAYDCSWNSLVAKVMNIFSPLEKTYIAKTKVVLFSSGPQAFNEAISKLNEKKMEIKRQEDGKKNLFWQDLDLKFQTLQAISLQIEQHFLDFLESNGKDFLKKKSVMIDKYSRKFGTFLTTFVLENETYFSKVEVDIPNKIHYRDIVRKTSKKIGEESSKFIENMRAMKKSPSKQELESLTGQVKKSFSSVKSDISQKLLLVSEDRVK